MVTRITNVTLSKKEVEGFLTNLMYRSILDREQIDDAYKELSNLFKSKRAQKKIEEEANQLTPTQAHKKRHKELHSALDELAADYISHTGNLPTSTTVMELMAWAFEQTKNPTEKIKDDSEFHEDASS